MVATEVLVGRKDMIWHSTESGRVLNLSVRSSSAFGGDSSAIVDSASPVLLELTKSLNVCD